MTTTTTYDPSTVPTRGDARSRFALPVSPSGITVQPAQNVLIAYEKLLDARRGESSPIEARTITLKKIVRVEGSKYVLIDAKTITIKPNAEARYGSGRFKSRGVGGAFLDEVFLGEKFDWPKDADLWAAAVELAEQEGFTGRDLNRLSFIVSCAVLIRAGVNDPKALVPWEIG